MEPHMEPGEKWKWKFEMKLKLKVKVWNESESLNEGKKWMFEMKKNGSVLRKSLISNIWYQWMAYLWWESQMIGHFCAT